MSQRQREKDGEQGHLQRDKNPHVAVVQQQGDCLENGSHHEVRRAEIRLRLVKEHMENEKVLETFIDKYWKLLGCEEAEQMGLQRDGWAREVYDFVSFSL